MSNLPPQTEAILSPGGEDDEDIIVIDRRALDRIESYVPNGDTTPNFIVRGRLLGGRGASDSARAIHELAEKNKTIRARAVDIGNAALNGA